MIEFRFIEAGQDDNESCVGRVVAELLDRCAAELIKQDGRDAPENNRDITARTG